jgi:hypothetical protein
MFTVWSVEEEERRGRVEWRERCQQRSRWPERVEMSVRLIGGDVVSIGNSTVFKKSRSSVASKRNTRKRALTLLPCCGSNATLTCRILVTKLEERPPEVGVSPKQVGTWAR